MLVGELAVALDVGRQLDALGVTWLLGGSLASSILGEPRATADVDLVADLRGPHVAALFAALVGAYYIDEGATRAAVRTRGAFNVIQLASMTKVDIYCSADEPLARAELRRRIFVEIDDQRIPCASPEDIILQKLLWFVAGGCVSDRQWRDIRGVIRVQGDALDRAYLEHHATSKGLSDLLQRALNQ
ncbi:MAG TPA: nucleotidyl transferase AbiEii/AbiGii toxin family protein [Kofleriaceae bacterium]|nr:nucleotidyl transferase AbiEii/AbiGii toxin family protein [Kofleriaceae bacterium]